MRNLKLPPRIQQIIIDSETGSYPTTSRIGSTNRTGRSLVSFDDTRTLVFSQSMTVNYPTLLPSGSRFIGLMTSSLSATAVGRKGIADNFVTFSDVVEQVGPFNESAHIENNVDPFFLTGSLREKVGFGFDSKLGSKAKIVIDLNPIVSTTVGYHVQGSPWSSGTGVDSYQMMYYDHSLRRWQGIFQGRKFLYDGPPEYNLQTQTCGFSPSIDYVDESVASGSAAVVLNAARPFDMFGFPYDARYHATSSQTYNLSGVIDGPFLVEKIFYEFSGTLQNASANMSVHSLEPRMFVPITTFFVLNQRGPALLQKVHRHDTAVLSYFVTHSLPQSLQLTTGSASPTLVTTSRDLVTYMQVVPVNNHFTATFPNQLQYVRRELMVSGSTASNEIAFSGKFAMSASLKAPMKSVMHCQKYLGGDTVYGGWEGGRSGLGKPTGRSFINDIDGNKHSGSVALATAGTFDFPVSQSQNNPYVLLPTDRLIFGWELPDGAFRPLADPGPRLSMHPGAGKVILYGTKLQNNQPYLNTLNQNLTSNAVHEDVHIDGVTDQFDTEPREQFSGSYLGEYITGSLSLVQSLRRRVQATTIVSGNYNHLFGDSFYGGAENRARILAFNRFIHCTSENERYYDSLMPRYDRVSVKDGSQIVTRFDGSGNPMYNIALLGTPMVTVGGTSYPNLAPNTTWFRAFPFEPRYSDIPRDRDVITNTEGTRRLSTGVFGTALDAPVLKRLTIAYTLIHSVSLTPSFPIMYLVDSDAGFATTRDIMLHLYGVGKFTVDTYTGDDGSRVSGTLGNAVHWSSRSLSTFSNDNLNGSIFRGFKYGVLNALPQFSHTVFRRDRFGQFRDILEQRRDSKFFDTIGLNADGTLSGRTGTTSSPIQVKFVEPSSGRVTQPTRTFSSNLSIEVTSSVPYFDGVVKNRENPLTMANINSYSLDE